MQRSTRRRTFLSVTAVCATTLWGGAALVGQDDPLLKTEPLPQVIQRTQQDKPAFAKRHQDLLALRYDLAIGRRRVRRCPAARPCRMAYA
jgi:hypothetical protein